MEFNQLYFYTASIANSKHLLKPDKNKDFIICCLQNLVFYTKIRVYAYVIMPNHIHFIWELLELNGNESPDTSFIKYTSNEFSKDIKIYRPDEIHDYDFELETHEYTFWRKVPIIIDISNKNHIYKKVDYIHHNPVHGKWSLANKPSEYIYSSAQYYEEGIDKFGIITDISERL